MAKNVKAKNEPLDNLDEAVKLSRACNPEASDEKSSGRSSNDDAEDKSGKTGVPVDDKDPLSRDILSSTAKSNSNP
jgi:hypothetical protein